MATTIDEYQLRYANYVAQYDVLKARANEILQEFEGMEINNFFATVMNLLKELSDTEDLIKEQLRLQVIAEAQAEFSIEINQALEKEDEPDPEPNPDGTE